MLLQIRPVQMARMIGKVGVALRSSVEQAIPRARPVVAFGFEYSTMPGWGRSMWYGRCTLGGRGAGSEGSLSSSGVFGVRRGCVCGSCGVGEAWWVVGCVVGAASSSV